MGNSIISDNQEGVWKYSKMLWIKMSVLSLTGGEKCSLDSYNFMEKTAVQTDFESNSGGGDPSYHKLCQDEILGNIHS